ncbi:HipA domain-containing protein [Beggiatoa alba B18LD]|uniref:HipA domain-containing protein n=1 Tax=Beggiatoa alba B18LD TaxID=395493 RepID=I3CEC4_9GAMM|nr:type II toxin-antitoxin system HipA family toxin [Beggiatoa alba]EIJ41967.1 HipA domain-containing protein [Beggiatoa alba B18LD]
MGKSLQTLNVLTNGVLVGKWEYTQNKDSFVYDNNWVKHGYPLSLSLPFTADNQRYQGEVVTNFFDNLLPDSDVIRRRLAVRHRATDTSPFQLLATIGRDCVGAIQLLPPDKIPTDLQTIQGKLLDNSEISQLLKNITVKNSFNEFEEDLRISIAGAQEKTALLFHNQQWLLPQGSTPSTHIFKLPIGLVGNTQADMQTSVENEWLCSKIVQAYGIDIAQCEIAQFEEQKVLIVERFDRKLASNQQWILRLPQEDFCQALGVSSLHKYQAEGGAGIADIMRILNSSEQATEDRKTFFKSQLIFWLLAACDGHAKNFSIFHLPNGNYRLTPLYDVLSFHPIAVTGKNKIPFQKLKLAIAVRGKSGNHYLVSKIQRRHWLEQANQVGLGEKTAEIILEELHNSTEQVLTSVEKCLPPNFPLNLAETIFNGIRKQGALLFH